MKILLSVICFILFVFVVVTIFKVKELSKIEYQEPEILSNKKILTVYYSNGGHTKDVAENLHGVVGGDVIEIKLNEKEKYPDNIFKMSMVVRKQMKQGYFPEIEYIDISDYDIIFAGSPI